MNVQEVEFFYNHYKTGLGLISKAENKLLKCSYNFEKWSESLKEKSDIIRSYYAENEHLIKDLMSISVNDLSKELADKLITHIDFFMSEGYRDYQVVVSVLNILIDYFTDHGPAYRLFDCYYFMATELMEVHEYSKACEYYRLALEIFKNPEKCKEEYRKFKIMCCHYYRLLAAACDENTNQKILSNYEQTALDVWVKNPIISFVTPKKKRCVEQIIRRIPCMAIDRYISAREVIRADIISEVYEEYYKERDVLGDELDIDAGIYVTYNKLRRYQNEITKGQYNVSICKKYQHDKLKETTFSYGTKDFLYIFDDETPDDEFEVDDLFYMNHSYAYVHYLIPEMIEIFRRNDFIGEIEKYYAYLPVVRGDYLLDYMIDIHIKKIFKYTKDVNEVIRILEKVLANRQVVTLIHSEMVSRLAVIMTDRFIRIAPELFVGTFGIKNIPGVYHNKEVIIDYVDRAARVHDIGKIMCADVINLQSRRISDAEFAMIKKHPAAGASILEKIPVLSDVKDVALGHHKSYDGMFGYPIDFDSLESPYKIYIDIIKLCDCIDAATDYLGRNYAKAKTFDTVLNELVEGKGNAYSDKLVDIISGDQYLIRSIEKLTGEERQHTYYEVYHKVIEPEIEFRPSDEVFVRKYRDEDKEELQRIFNVPADKFNNMLEECNFRAGVLTDGNGKIYGGALIKDREDHMEIYNIAIDKKFRKKGYGTNLVNEIVTIARKEGYNKLLMPLVTKGHYEIFGWRNGFTESKTAGMMEKDI